MASKKDSLFECASMAYREGKSSTGNALSENIGYLSGIASALRISGQYPDLLTACEQWVRLLDERRRNLS